MHHADRLNVVVSGASIIAKVIRDSEISKIRMEYGDIGSGYPSDKKNDKVCKKNGLDKIVKFPHLQENHGNLLN